MKAVTELPKPAFFLDRDGVITVEKGYVTGIADLEIFPYVKACVEKIHRAGYKAIVISNQSAVGRGYMTEATLKKMNRYLQDATGVDSVYYCPHWYNPIGAQSKYNVECSCRKPNTGLLEKAVQEHNVALKDSYFVGDRETDIQAGKNMGTKTVLVKSGYDISEYLEKADYVFEDLRDLVEGLL